MSFFAAAKFWCRQATYFRRQAEHYMARFYEADRQLAHYRHVVEISFDRQIYDAEQIARLRKETSSPDAEQPRTTATFGPTKEFAGDFAVDITALPLEAGAVDPTRRYNSAGEAIAELHLPGGRTRHAKVDNLRRCFGVNDEPPADVNVLLDIGDEGAFPFLHRSPVPGDLWYWSHGLEGAKGDGPWDCVRFSSAQADSKGALIEPRPTDRSILEQRGY